MRIGIIIAMDKELAQMRTLLSNAHTEKEGHLEYILGNIGDKEIIMQKCGIGKVNAAVGATEMIIHYHPDIILSTGCAGGASTSLHVTDVVAGSQYTYHDVYCGSEVSYGQFVGMPAVFPADAQLLEKVKSLHTSIPIHTGMMVSGDWFVDSREKIRDILDHFPEATAVDMESGAIAQTCYLHEVPFISFRVISDIPLSDDKASQYFDFWERLANGSFEVTKSFIEAL